MSLVPHNGWFRRFVEAVRPTGARSPGLSSLDHSLAAAFVAVAQPATAAANAARSADVAGDLLFGPQSVGSSRRRGPASALGSAASQDPTRQRTPLPAGLTGWSSPGFPGRMVANGESLRSAGAGGAGSRTTPRTIDTAVPSWSSRIVSPSPTEDRFSPFSTSSVNPPHTPVSWDGTNGDGTNGANQGARAISPETLAALEARLAACTPPGSESVAEGSGPAVGGSPPVIPLVELLRDLAPASPFETRLETLWQQRRSAVGMSGLESGLGTGPEADSAGWCELMRRLADLEAGQGE